MPARLPRSKSSSVTEKRLRRMLSADETFRLAAYARALKLRRNQQQRIYKPRMELWDDGDNPLVTAVFELPGMRPEDVSVDVVDGRLIVSGERCPHPLSNAQTHDEHDEDEARDGSKSTAGLSQRRILQVCELKYGFFRRVVAVPTGCTTQNLDAFLENGMLTVSWPRTPTHGERFNGPNAESLHVHSDTPPDGDSAQRFSGSHSCCSL